MAKILIPAMIAAVILCIVLVQVFQSAGDIMARRIDRRNR